jgi:hypothetical protein
VCIPLVGAGFRRGGVTRLLIVDTPMVLMMWMTSCRMKTVRRMEGMVDGGRGPSGSRFSSLGGMGRDAMGGRL